MQKDELFAVGKSLLWFLGFVIAITLLVTLGISALFDLSFWSVLIWTSIIAVMAIGIWLRAIWVPGGKNEPKAIRKLKRFWLSQGWKIAVVMAIFSLLMIYFGGIIWLGLIFICPKCSMQITLAENLVYVACVTGLLSTMSVVILPSRSREKKSDPNLKES